ncbi:hypothetical protein V6N12_031019 [Hibiscus sabdariffa]|uniref:Uncharacterized protein n=1 Tax=Hibiscus sabdariffa TaxID=183260 RepID=A0ABR2E9P6_9ROSI
MTRKIIITTCSSCNEWCILCRLWDIASSQDLRNTGIIGMPLNGDEEPEETLPSPSVVAAQPEAHAGSSLHGTSIHGISPICSQGAELDANEDVVRCTDTWSPDCHPPSIVDLSSVTQSFVDVDPPVVEAQKDVELSILDLGVGQDRTLDAVTSVVAPRIGHHTSTRRVW